MINNSLQLPADFEEQMQDALVTDDQRLAKRLLVLLKKSLGVAGKPLTAPLPGSHGSDAVRLAWVALATLTEDEVLYLIRTSLGVTAEIPEFDLEVKMELFIEALVTPAEQMPFIEQLVAAFKESQSVVGTSAITVGGRQVQPLVRYWIDDYNQLPTKSVERSELEELNYLNTSPNVKSLDSVGQRTLLAILKVYDQYNTVLNDFRALPDPTEEEAFKDFDLLDTISGLEPEENDSEPVVPSVPAASRPAPAAQPLPRSAVSASVPTPALQPTRLPPRPLNLQDVLVNRDSASPRVAFGKPLVAPPTSVRRPEPIQKPSPQKETDIDKKLQELKNRTDREKTQER